MKLKNIIATLLCLSLVSFALCSTASAAINLNEKFVTTNDFFLRNDTARGAIITPDLGKAITYGNAQGTIQQIGIIIQNLQTGAIVQKSTYGVVGASYNSIADLALCNDGSIVGAGSAIVSGQGLNGAVFKIDNLGNVVWWHIFDNPTYHNTDIFNSVAVDIAGDVYCTGLTYNGTANYYDIITMKLDGTTGSEIWRRDYHYYYHDTGKKIFFDSAHNIIYVCGDSESSTTGYDFNVLCYGLDGTLRWTTRTDNSGARDLLQDADLSNGSLYLTGVTYNPGANGLTVKVNSDGTEAWKRVEPGLNVTVFGGISADENGNSCTSGNSRIDPTQPTKAIATRYDVNGNKIYTVYPSDAITSLFTDVKTVSQPRELSFYAGRSSRTPTGTDALLVALNADGETQAVKLFDQGYENIYNGIDAIDNYTVAAGTCRDLTAPTRIDYLTAAYEVKGGGGQVKVPKGTNITVNPVPEITITFDSVIEEGDLYANPVVASPSPFVVHIATWDLDTTAVYEGDIHLTIEYPDTVPPELELYLSIIRLAALDTMQGSEPLGTAINEVLNTVSTTLGSLSAYDVAYPPEAAPAIEYLIARVQSMNLKAGIENSLDVKLQSAVDALEEARKNALLTAINKIQAFINECEAQKGKALTEEQADELIGWANFIIRRMQ